MSLVHPKTKMTWNFTPPSDSSLHDHGVVSTGTHLHGKRIALLITGSIAAYRTPDLVRELRREGAEVVVFASQEGLRYVAKDALEWTSLHRVVDSFTPDAEHLSDSAPFDAYLVAPATYNVINKMAQGIADSVVTSTLASAIGKMERGPTQVLVVPTMHGSMHNSLLTESLKKLDALGVRIVPPRQENGKNNLPSHEILVAETIRSLSRSALQGRGILITGGPTPVPIDHIRRLTNRFTGALAIEIAKEAYFQGADVHLLLGVGSHPSPEYVRTYPIPTYNEYVSTIENVLKTQSIRFGIFSAAVADYQPESVYAGKLPSGNSEQTLRLVPTNKVIRQVRSQFPDLRMVTFKYEENLSHEALMQIARGRLAEGYTLVVANRGEEQGAEGQQKAWLVEADQPEQSVDGKPQIAQALLKRLAHHLQ